MTVIALDAMGGDFAPRVPVEAAVRAVRDSGMDVLLVGDPELLAAELERHAYDPARLRIVPASDTLGMDEPPSLLLREKAGASVRVACECVARGEAAAVVSAGHSGALMVAARHVLKPLPGVERPAIATVLPQRRGAAVLLDSGANVDCKPRFLLHFALMGRLYAEHVLGIAEPRTALLSNGSEPGKGNQLVRLAHPLLAESVPGFLGNLEARDLFRGRADVLVCDGFAGNLVLKTAEAAGAQMRVLLKDGLRRSLFTRLGAWLIRDLLGGLLARTDYHEIGGSLLLGLGGPALVSHGASNASTLANALHQAHRIAGSGLTEAMRQAFTLPLDSGTETESDAE